MAIQVTRARERGPSTADQFAQAFGESAGKIGSALAGRYRKEEEDKVRKEKEDKENEFYNRILGEDVSGASPKQKEILLTQKLNGQRAKELENQKQEGKKDILSEKQSFLDKILSPSKSNEQGNAEENQGFDPSNISDEDIIKAEAQGLKGLREAKDASIRKSDKAETEKRRKFESDRDYNSKISDPIIKSAESIVRETPIKRALISQQRRDIASGNTSGILPFMVDKLGLEVYRDPESARFKTASKERFVSTVHELGTSGARANQFIEQQLVAAQAALGRSEEANDSVLDLEEFILDAKETRAQYELDLAEQDIEKEGFARRDISSRADKMMKSYIEQRQDEMAYDIRKRHEQNMDDQQLTQEIVSGNIGPDTPLTMRAARILMIKNNDDEKKAQAEAKKLGFRLPTEKTYSR